MGRPFANGCLCALATTLLSAQTTYVVTGGGGALQAAIQVAAPGDTLDVQAGAYSAATCSKGLRIALRPGADISGTPALTVTGIPTSERFQIDGGLITGITVGQCTGTVIVDGTRIHGPTQIDSCSGAVVFDEADYTMLVPYTIGTLPVTNSTQVSFNSCYLPQLVVTNSRVNMSNCLVQPSGVPGPGLHLVSGSVTISRGLVTGVVFPFMAIPAPAIRIDQGELVATAFADLRAWQPGITTTHAIAVNGGSVRLDPTVSVTGTPPIVGALGNVVTTPIPGLYTSHGPTTLAFTVYGQGGSAVFTFAGPATQPLTTPWGAAWLLPTDPILDATVLPPFGYSTTSRTFPSVPPYFLLGMQSVALTPTGSLVIGTPVRFVWD